MYVLYNANTKNPIIRKLQLNNYPKNFNFYPLGIDENKGKLYVINNALEQGQRIEIF